MMCESCEKQFLPYLYDLLDAPEREELDAHLRNCPHCTVELERARGRRADIATAVKSSFPNILFKTPSRSPVKTARAAPPPRVPRRPLLLSRWAMAAAVLFAVLSVGAVGAACMYYYQSSVVAERRQVVTDLRAELGRAQQRVNAKQAHLTKDIEDIKGEVDRLLGKWDQEVQRKQDPKQQSVFFEIKGPRTVQAGGVNRYEVQVKPANAQQRPNITGLRAEVEVGTDKKKTVVFEKTLAPKERTQLVLPPDLPVKPGDDMTLVLHADVDGGPAEVREQLTLAFPDYVTYLSTDRPMYRPGEALRFRSLTLERFSLQPAREDLALRFRITAANNVEVFKRDVSTRVIAGKDKHSVQGPDGQPLHGIGTGEFTLPRQLPSGVYTLSVSEANDRFPEEKRTFIVHRWQAPRFNKEIAFDRGSYGPGENVAIRGKVTRLAQQAGMPAGMMGGGGMAAGMPAGGVAPPPPPVFGGPLNIQIHMSVVVDGVQTQAVDRNTDADGSFEFDFALPAPMTQGNGVVTLQFNDNGTSETLVRTIPIVLRDVFVDFYPEGGDLVLGVPNRVYFQARTGAYTPVAARGRLLERDVTYDKRGTEILGKQVRDVTPIATFADPAAPGLGKGLGAFRFVPKAGRVYYVQLDAPVGNARPYRVAAPRAQKGSVPTVHVPKTDGVMLYLPEGVIAKDIPVTLYSTQHDRELLVGAYCRGKLLDSVPVTVRAGANADVVLHPAVDVGGVYRITVFDKQQTAYKPVAERLLFRKQSARLHVAVRPEQSEYTPGQAVTLHLAATNEHKQFVPSVVMCAVVDSSVFKLAGDKAERGMPAHFLLTSEIRRPEDLENADALLNETNPQAAEALDLLLGTQGWRRFAEQDPQKFLQKHRDDRPKAFLASAKTTAQVSAGGQKMLENIDRKFAGEFITWEAKLAQKEREKDSVPELQQAAIADNTWQAAVHTHDQEVERLRDLQGFFVQAGFSAVIGLLIFFAFFLVATSLYRLAEGKSGFIFLGIGLCLLGFLFVVSVFGTFVMIGTSVENRFFNRRGPFFGMAATPAVKMPMPPQAQGMVFVQIPDDPRWQLERPEQMEAGTPPGSGPGGMGMGVQQPMAGNPNDPQGFDVERTLRQQGRYQELLQRKLNRRVQIPAPVESSVVREYAHRHPADPGKARRDFAETLYWQPALVLNDGQGTVRFELSDAVTDFRVLAVSHSLDGRLGTDTIEFSSRLPYQIEPKLPVEIASSDRPTVPVVVSNHAKAATTFPINLQRADGVRLVEAVPLPNEAADKPMTIPPGQSRRRLFKFAPTITSGTARLRFQGKFAMGNDTVERSFAIAPDGFPINESVSGTLEGTAPFTKEIFMPEERWIAGTLTLQVQGYPSLLADLQQSADALLREPHACFEQAASSNYANVLLLNYLKDRKQSNPAIEARARGALERGYQQLAAFECVVPGQTRHGYEWFSPTAPPQEGLTAYGLLQFHDMARVYPVDQAMIARTRQFLLDQRDGKGGFKRDARSDQFGRAPADISNAYIVWALTETGTRDELATELKTLGDQAVKSTDPYFVALNGLSQLNAGRKESGEELLRRLRNFQQASGEMAGARTSITNSTGRDLSIETTALAALGWARAGQPAEFQTSAKKAGDWLLKQRAGSGSFGATQSTVLALKALTALAAQKPPRIQPADLRVEVTRGNGQMVSGEARLRPGMTEPITVRLNDAPGEDKQDALLASGANVVNVRLTDGNNRLPFTLSWSYRARKPVGSAIRPVELSTLLSKAEVTEGDTLNLHVNVQNKSGQDEGMAIAVVGLPAGLALPDDFRQLKELARLTDDGKPGKLAAWEMHGSRELVLYWRELKANAKIELDLNLIARLPGVYSGPPSQAYLYYNAAHKHWVDPLHVRVNDLP